MTFKKHCTADNSIRFLLIKLSLLALLQYVAAFCTSDAACPHPEVCQNSFCVDPALPPCSACDCSSSPNQLCLDGREKDTPISPCNQYWGLDGIGLQAEKVVHKGGAQAPFIQNYRIRHRR